MGKKKISLEEIAKKQKIEDYTALAQYVYQQIENGRIKPVKSHGTNGKSPALYKDYHVLEEEKDYSQYLDEIRYQLSSKIDISYYLAHPLQYVAEREEVLALSRYLSEKKEDSCPVSVNERSFEIWGREKFLSGQGKQNGVEVTSKMVLKHTGISLEQLNVYETAEPLAYYCRSRQVPQNILIIENKDTFYSLRQHLMEGDGSLFGVQIDTLIYGAGKGISKAFSHRSLSVEPYVQDERNQLYYLGDIDFEGIRIYEQLQEKFQEEVKILPFVEAYERMVNKALKEYGIRGLPETKEGQNRSLNGSFMTYFTENIQKNMYEILDSGKYIPQEIINRQDDL